MCTHSTQSNLRTIKATQVQLATIVKCLYPDEHYRNKIGLFSNWLRPHGAINIIYVAQDNTQQLLRDSTRLIILNWLHDATGLVMLSENDAHGV